MSFRKINSKVEVAQQYVILGKVAQTISLKANKRQYKDLVSVKARLHEAKQNGRMTCQIENQGLKDPKKNQFVPKILSRIV